MLALSPALAQEGVLELDVRTEDGEKVPAKNLRIEVFAARDFSEFGAQWKQTRGQLRYGQYQVEVWAAGFRTARQMVNHGDPVTKVRVGLSVGSVGEPLPSAVRIKAEPVPEATRDMWVQLFPLHSGKSSPNKRFRTDGTVEFQDLDPTPYLLVVVETTGRLGNPVRILVNRLIKPRLSDDEGRDVIRIKSRR